MQQRPRPHIGWPIYGPPVAPATRFRRFATPPPAPRVGRPIQLPPVEDNDEVFPAAFVLQAPPPTNVVYDIRLPPSTLRSAPCAPFRITAFDLDVPFACSRPPSIRIISKDFPWAFIVYETTRGAGVTCREVLVALYESLQIPLADHEWGFSSDDLRERMVRAWKRRETLGGAGTSLLKRVDLLGGRCKLQGFRRDKDFAAERFLPGTRPVPDTWTVRFIH